MKSGSQTGIVVSELNTNTVETLAGAASFTGLADNVSQYSETTINLFGTPAIAPGTLIFEYGRDGVNWDTSVSYTLAGPQSFVPLPLRSVLPFFRVRYVNGATPLTVFRLTTVFHWESAKHITRVINQSIDENEPVEMTRSIQAGKSPDGPYTNLPATGVAASQSSNTLLGVSGVFNASGTIVSTQGYLSAAISIVSSHNGSTNGLLFNWYADSLGTRSLGMTSFSYGNAPSLTQVQVPIKGPYLRVTYTNGTTAQTLFELVTTLLVTAPPPDVLPISSTITGNNAASITKAQIVGLKENGAYSDSRLSNSSSQMVAVADRPSEVRSRTHVSINIPRTALVAGGTTLYTVTVGKKLFVNNFSINYLNDSNAIGEWRLRDSATVKNTSLSAPRSGTIPDAAAVVAPTLPEPMQFATNINVVEITGVIEISGFIIGYEEPL